MVSLAFSRTHLHFVRSPLAVCPISLAQSPWLTLLNVGKAIPSFLLFQSGSAWMGMGAEEMLFSSPGVQKSWINYAKWAYQKPPWFVTSPAFHSPALRCSRNHLLSTQYCIAPFNLLLTKYYSRVYTIHLRHKHQFKGKGKVPGRLESWTTLCGWGLSIPAAAGCQVGWFLLTETFLIQAK